MYELYSGVLMRYAWTLTGDGWLAQDAVQECFLRYFALRRQGQAIDKPRAWLMAVLRNYLLDARRKRGPAENAALEAAAGRPDPLQDPYGSLRGLELEQVLAKQLSARERDCLQLKLQGMKQSEIASALGLRNGTVGVLLSRASRKLREAAGF